MKNFIFICLIITLLSLPAFANPFVDVPPNHWAYDAVNILAARGIIIGYPDGTFGGNRSMTRYEFAQAVARGIAHIEMYLDEAGRVNQSDIILLDKLVQEFADELKNLGVTIEELKRVLGENSQAIQVLETRVSNLDKYAEPVKISGDFTATYEAFFPSDPKAQKTDATWKDETNLYIAATINDYTVAGFELNILDTFSTPTITPDNFFIHYQKDAWEIHVGDIRQAKIDLGLVMGDFQPDDPDDDRGYDLDFEGAYFTYTPEDSNLSWRGIGATNTFYSVRAEWEQFAVMTTLMPDAAELISDSADLIISASGWTDFGNSDVTLTLEGAYGAMTNTYGLAGELEILASEDATITLDGHYVSDGFPPSANTINTSAFADDRMGFGVTGSFDLSSNEPESDKWKLSLYYDWEAVISTGTVNTNQIEAVVNYTPFGGAKGESAKIRALYSLLNNNITAYAGYYNYPLDIDSENNAAFLTGEVQYKTSNQEITAVGQLKYEWIEEKTILTVEGRYDSVTPTDVNPWSVLAQIDWAMADNTDLCLSYELNTWEDDDDYTGQIIDNAGTLTAEVSLKF